jgi:hypothetical protein
LLEVSLAVAACRARKLTRVGFPNWLFSMMRLGIGMKCNAIQGEALQMNDGLGHALSAEPI